jgi:hypothetical protein
MRIVHKWLRKRPYALCKSCRGLIGLQLSYLSLGPLQLKNLEKNWFKQSQMKSKQSCRARRSRPRAMLCMWSHRAEPPADWARPPEHPCDRWTQGLPPTFAPNPPSPRAVHSRAARNRHAPTDQRRHRRTPTPRAHVAALSAVLRPCRDPHRDWPQRGAQATPQPPRAVHKSPSFTRVSTKPPPSAICVVPVSSLRRAILVPQARLKLPPAPRELARPRVVLAVPPARRITVPGGRPIAAADELHPPRDPRANQPPQHIR